MTRHAHLVGSVGLRDAETVFTTISNILGPFCSRIPDGETGDRTHWIRWQRDAFASHPDFEPAVTSRSFPGFANDMEHTFFKLADGIEPGKLEFGGMGYAWEAIESYRTFDRLVNEGTVGSDKRFQVALPTPMALVCGFVVPDDRLAVEPAIEAAIVDELHRIQHTVPASRLSIQWDVCFEVVAADGGFQLPYSDAITGSVERISHLCRHVKDEAEVGIHLCYGDAGHRHLVEPSDLDASVAFANGISRACPRPLDFVHMPVPRDRADDGYFAPLQRLELSPRTRLVLGLVHYTDGVDGSRRRMAIAQRYARDFDVATECGFGRRDPATIPELLHIHRELCC
jgi:hypothetical protein